MNSYEADQLRIELKAYKRERDALAIQLAQHWGWPPKPDSVLTRLRGDQTAALTTFSEEAYAAYLGIQLSEKETE